MKPFLSVHNITIRLQSKLLFANTSWEMMVGEHWLITGPNGAGKSTFAKALAGLVPLKHGEVVVQFGKKGRGEYPQQNRELIAYVSFDKEEQLYLQEEREKEFASVVGREGEGRVVGEFLTGIKNYESGIRKKDKTKTMTHNSFFLIPIADLLNRQVSTLSTGERKKVFLIKAFLQKPRLLILDEPFNGLDSESKKLFMQTLEQLVQTTKTQIILITHQHDEVPTFITHEMKIRDGKIVNQKQKKEFYSSSGVRSTKSRSSIYNSSGSSRPALPAGRQAQTKKHVGKKILIDMQHVTVQYGKKKVLDDITWQMFEGEHWGILGPNGAGKSSLIKLLTGESLQGYANSVNVFGHELGTGMSLWERRKLIGLVSPELQLTYQRKSTVMSVILSGFFDSVGLYAQPTTAQKKKAMNVVTLLGVTSLIAQSYHELSLGQKRLILIARAFVKSPKLLILDEPCQNLDRENTKKVLSLIAKIGKTGKTNLILITHRQEEIIPIFQHVLLLKEGKRI